MASEYGARRSKYAFVNVNWNWRYHEEAAGIMTGFDKSVQYMMIIIMLCLS